MKILFLSPLTYDTCSFYRSGGIAGDLAEKLGYEIEITSLDKRKFNWQDMMQYKLVMFQRAFSETSVQMAMYVKSLNIPVWVDMDDYMLDLPAGNPAYELLTLNKENIIKMIALADMVTVTTEMLRQQLLPFNKNIRIIPNAINDRIFRKRSAEIERQKIILWRGGDSHVPDLMRYARIIDKMMVNYPDWDYKFMGYLPWFYNNYGNLSYIQSTDPIFYFKKLVSLQATALHVPLDDSTFNRCKSNIAWIEATYAGAITIAPAWDEWKMPGVLNYKDDDEYYNLVSKVIAGDIDTRKMVERSWSYISDKLTLSEVNKLRVQVVKHLLS